VVVVLHDLNLAMQYAHKMLLLKKGRVIAGGTLTQVMTEKNLSEAYDFPIHLLNHTGYEYPIVMPATQPLSLNA
jgi:iron complex transport system ATP-binding protein